MKYVVIIVILLILLFVFMYNTMMRKRNKVNTAFSSMDVMLKKRYDVMPNLASMIEKHMKHEKDILTTITELRTRIDKSNDINESVALNNEIEEAVKQFNLSVERYPELKSNENFLHMQRTLNEIEDEIAAARRTYNAHCEAYNTFISLIPFNIFASILGFEPFKQFEIKEEDRENKIWMK